MLYIRIYFVYLIPFFSDVNECNQTPCDNNAVCTNTPGSYQCVCNGGYSGDGNTCAGNIVKQLC